MLFHFGVTIQAKRKMGGEVSLVVCADICNPRLWEVQPEDQRSKIHLECTLIPVSKTTNGEKIICSETSM